MSLELKARLELATPPYKSGGLHYLHFSRDSLSSRNITLFSTRALVTFTVHSAYVLALVSWIWDILSDNSVVRLKR